MKLLRRSLESLLMCSATLAFVACNGNNPYTPPPPPPPGGFYIQILDVNSQGVITEHLDGHLVGDWLQDISPSAQGSTRHLDTGAAWPNYVTDGRAPAFWSGTISSITGCGRTPPGTWSGNIVAINSTFTAAQCGPGFASSDVFYNTAIPATITIQSSGLTTTGGMPILTVTDVKEARLPQVTATSVAPGGTAATFPFPKLANGNPLPSGVYGFNIANQATPGVLVEQAANFFSLAAQSSSFTTPYGVDALNSLITTCESSVCDAGVTQPYAIATLSSLNQISVDTRTSGTAAVGSQPVAIRGYKRTSTTTCNRSLCKTVVKPGSAVIANSGSGTVSVVNLLTKSLTATIPVGTQPVSVILNAVPYSATKAYVANLGSATVSEINLTTNVQARTVAVGNSPAALVMDPSGTSFWVGGNGYISQVDATTFAVTKTYAVTGQVTGLLISQGQNAFVYTTVDTSSNFKVQTANFGNGQFMNTEYQANFPGTSIYAQPGSATSLPGWVMSSGSLVSASFGNRYYVSGTPTGYVVIDLQTNTQMVQGSTASPVRGLATDPVQGTIYVTAPESNTFITVPLFPTT